MSPASQPVCVDADASLNRVSLIGEKESGTLESCAILQHGACVLTFILHPLAQLNLDQ